MPLFSTAWLSLPNQEVHDLTMKKNDKKQIDVIFGPEAEVWVLD